MGKEADLNSRSQTSALMESRRPAADYQFLTNHAQVLLCVAHDPGIRLRDIPQTVGVTERSAHRIVSQLARTATSFGSELVGETSTRSGPRYRCTIP
jgi:hypothetical protein